MFVLCISPPLILLILAGFQIRTKTDGSEAPQAVVHLTYLFEIKLGKEEPGLYMWLQARSRQEKEKISVSLRLEPSKLHRKTAPPKLARMKAQRAVLALENNEHIESNEKNLGDVVVVKSEVRIGSVYVCYAEVT